MRAFIILRGKTEGVPFEGKMKGASHSSTIE